MNTLPEERLIKNPSWENIIDALKAEEEYQNTLWPKPEHSHEIESYIVYMEDYLGACRRFLSRQDKKFAYPSALDCLRKVVMLGIACIKEHGLVTRE